MPSLSSATSLLLCNRVSTLSPSPPPPPPAATTAATAPPPASKGSDVGEKFFVMGGCSCSCGCGCVGGDPLPRNASPPQADSRSPSATRLCEIDEVND